LQFVSVLFSLFIYFSFSIFLFYYFSNSAKFQFQLQLLGAPEVEVGLKVSDDGDYLFVCLLSCFSLLVVVVLSDHVCACVSNGFKSAPVPRPIAARIFFPFLLFLS